MTFAGRSATLLAPAAPDVAPAALHELGRQAPELAPAIPRSTLSGGWTPPAAGEQVAMIRPILQGLQWAVRNPQVMRATINWIEKRAATQATKRLSGIASGARTECLHSCGQAMKSALGKAATPGGLPQGARSPQELVAQLNRLVSNEFAKLKIPEALRSTYQAAANDAIEAGVKSLAHTLRTAAVSGAAGVLGKIGWDEAAKLLREANQPETPENIRLLQEIKSELRLLRQETRNSPAR